MHATIKDIYALIKPVLVEKISNQLKLYIWCMCAQPLLLIYCEVTCIYECSIPLQ